jgi:hypothetical protein
MIPPARSDLIFSGAKKKIDGARGFYKLSGSTDPIL